MAYIGSVGLGIPDYEITQSDAKQLAHSLFSGAFKDTERLLSVFDRSDIQTRQLVVGLDWLQQQHTFKERNDYYIQAVVKHVLSAIDECLTNPDFLQTTVPFEAIDLIVFVSSTGIATPSIDAHILNERPFKDNMKRMPLWGLGCVGGAAGLALANDWLQAHPDRNALVVCAETASLTFQHNDKQKSNLIGTALFGDGMGAALLMGETSSVKSVRQTKSPKITTSSSYTIKETMDVMGWKVVDDGFEIVFSKKIPGLVRTVWKQHVDAFLQQTHMNAEEMDSFIVHPGGKKVLDAMEETLSIDAGKMKHSRHVLRDHGNMSSATLMYVLKRWMTDHQVTQHRSLMSALGPGFTSELIALEWD